MYRDRALGFHFFKPGAALGAAPCLSECCGANKSGPIPGHKRFSIYDFKFKKVKSHLFLPIFDRLPIEDRPLSASSAISRNPHL